MQERQFVAIRFNPWDRQTYTYHNDGPPVRIGDEVQVPGRGGRPQAVKVEMIIHQAPAFQTKAVIQPRPEQAALCFDPPVSPEGTNADPSR